MSEEDKLVSLERALISDAQSTTIEVSPAAAEHLGAWQIDQHIMALHEAGHAIAAAVLGLPVKAIDIKGRGHGRTELGLNEDTVPGYMPRSRLCDVTVMALGGWAIEVEVLGQPSTGSGDDLERATGHVIEMASSGMLDSAPFVSPNGFRNLGYSGGIELPEFLADEFGRAILAELATARARALDLAAKHRDQVIALARIVVARRRLTDNELSEAIRSAGVEPAPTGQ